VYKYAFVKSLAKVNQSHLVSEILGTTEILIFKPIDVQAEHIDLYPIVLEQKECDDWS